MSDASSPIVQLDLGGTLGPAKSGKVREVFTLEDGSLLFAATDRLSAYDVIMKNGILHKGALLTAISAHWFDYLSKQVPGLQTHLLSVSVPALAAEKLSPAALAQLKGRCMHVRSLKVFPIEAIVRGYITGSAWNEYREKGTVHGITVSGPGGSRLQESEKLERPIYTPSTKAEAGEKDENIHPDEAAKIIGNPKHAARIEELALELYTKAAEYALERGIIIADTKFEFGLDQATDEVVLVDEVLTPDSSRFWPKASYEVGRGQDSFDKQYLRDWLTSNGLKGKADVEIPAEISAKTTQKYQDAYEMLVGRKWDQA